MNVFLIYPYSSQHQLVKSFSVELAKYGVVLDYICIGDLTYRVDEKKWPFFLIALLKRLSAKKSGFISHCIFSLLIRWILSGRIANVLQKYDLIDFHAYVLAYNNLIKTCVEKKITFDITPWGSDVLRASNDTINHQYLGYSHCRYIKCTENLQVELNKKTNNLFKSKLRTLYLGNEFFPIIDSLSGKNSQKLKSSLYGNIDNRLVIVCGYNGSEHQNHLQMINSLLSMQDKIRDKVYLVFPFTYGSTVEYKASISKKLSELALNYTMLTDYLSVEELAALRKTADIVVNIQDTDALAGSLQEHLYCGNVCIFGSWLNYIPYDVNNIYYIKTSMQDLSENLFNVIENYSDYKNRCENNVLKMRKLFSWDETAINWANNYVE